MTTTEPDHAIPAYATTEIVTNAPTRSARLKWVIIVNNTLATGPLINAVACISASTGAFVEGLIARGGPDATGHHHPGLPWAGCTVLAATPEQLSAIQGSATASDGVLVVDMPTAAQNRLFPFAVGVIG